MKLPTAQEMATELAKLEAEQASKDDGSRTIAEWSEHLGVERHRMSRQISQALEAGLM